MTTRCSICGREVAENETLCKYHEKAYLNLRGAYDTWKAALEITWEQYLHQVVANDHAGEWTKEIASYLLTEKQRNTKSLLSGSPTDSPYPP